LIDFGLAGKVHDLNFEI